MNTESVCKWKNVAENCTQSMSVTYAYKVYFPVRIAIFLFPLFVVKLDQENTDLYLKVTGFKEKMW